MSLTMEKVYQILDFLKESENCSLNIDAGDVKISIVKGNIATPVAAVAPAMSVAPAPVVAAPTTTAPAAVAAPVVAATSEAAATVTETATLDDVDEAQLIPIKANVTSVFYRRPSPDEAPFVEVGDEVQEDTCVCLLEVMKLFRQVMADVHGRIEKILVNDGDLVEAGTVMFLVKPL